MQQARLSQHASLETMPSELLVEVAGHLDGRDIARLSCCSATLRQVVADSSSDICARAAVVHMNPALAYVYTGTPSWPRHLSSHRSPS